jgi:alpha-L-fucosidase
MPHVAPWFPAAKFGVFIHWVLPSVERALPEAERPASPDRRERARELARRFTAERFDAREWARAFRSWGARYAVLTTKHHVGFALFDCPVSRFTAAKSSPAGRDLVREYVKALHEEGLKVGLYYSLPDWSHPDYASLAAPRGGEEFDPMKYSREDEPERWSRFLGDMFAEVRHLCTACGRVDLVWSDGDWERTAEQWRTPELAAMMESLQPGIVLNNRFRHACIGHYGTPEQAVPLVPPSGWWEQCQTLGDLWSYDPGETGLKTPGELVRMLSDIVTGGGNLLLNVSPRADGTIPERQAGLMAGLGRWLGANGEAIYDTEAGLSPYNFAGGSTRKGSVLYLIAYDLPREEICVKGVRSRVAHATHLSTGTRLDWRVSGGRAKFGRPGWLFVRVPRGLFERDEHASVVRLEFEGDTLEVETPEGARTFRGRPPADERSVAEAR